jgi:hypothetical protein
MFHRGSEIPGDHPRLEGDGKLVRTMRCTDIDQLEARRADLEAAIRAWCNLKDGSSKSKRNHVAGARCDDPAGHPSVTWLAQ